jgi:ubiquinone/menaquinone biosynthesis C-methylase UbiE
MLEPRPGEHVLELGCGPGALAPHVVAAGARYTGVDLSHKLIAAARRHHGHRGRFVVGDDRAAGAGIPPESSASGGSIAI